MSGCQQWTAAQDLRLMKTDKGGILLRRGVWSFEEVQLNLQNEPPARTEAVRQLFDCYLSNTAVPSEVSAVVDEDEDLTSVLHQLVDTEFLVDRQQENADVARYLLGHESQAARREKPPLKGLLFCDNPRLTAHLERQSGELGLNMNRAARSLVELVSRCDYAAQIDGYHRERAWQELEQELEGYDVFLCVYQLLNTNTLRNLNQLLLRRKQRSSYLILSYVDGPFAGVCVLRPGWTACFSCLEWRVMSRLQDHLLYERFQKESVTAIEPRAPHHSPVLEWQSSMALGEWVALEGLGQSKFCGRLLSVFVPQWETHNQKVLKTGLCPACGYDASQGLKRLNVAPDRLLARLEAQRAKGG